MIKANAYVKERNARLIGPNCPGIITQVKLKLVLCQVLFSKGTVGIVSKSGTLTYEAADQVVKQGLESLIIGTTTKEVVELLMKPRNRMYRNDRWWST
jgi:succinyl-CoA synthetase alpha subunit